MQRYTAPANANSEASENHMLVMRCSSSFGKVRVFGMLCSDNKCVSSFHCNQISSIWEVHGRPTTLSPTTISVTKFSSMIVGENKPIIAIECPGNVGHKNSLSDIHTRVDISNCRAEVIMDGVPFYSQGQSVLGMVSTDLISLMAGSIARVQ